MKKFLLSFLLATSVFAQGDPPPYVKGQSASGLGNLGSTIQVPKNQSTKLNSYQARIETGNTNELRNPSFEGSPYNSGWTCPAGTISQAVGPDGFKALGIVSSGAGFECNQTFTSTADLKGTLARFFARVKTSAPNTFVCGLDGGSAAGNRVNCQKVSLTNADKVFSETSGFFNYGNMVYGIAIYSSDTAAFPTVIDEVSMGAAGLTTATIQSDTVYSAKISNTGVVSQESKDFINGNCTVASAAYSCPLLTGLVSAPMNCVVQVENATSLTRTANLDTYTSTNIAYRTFEGGTPTALATYIICEKQGADYANSSSSGILSSNADTNWTNFTPTGGWTTNTTYTGKYKYVGDSAVIQLKIATSGAPGGNTALSMDMPALIGVIDTAKLVGQNVFTNSGNLIDTGSATYDIRAIAATNTLITFYSNLSNVAKTHPMTWTSGDFAEVTFTVPIVGRSQSPTAIIPLAGTATTPGYSGQVDDLVFGFGDTSSTPCTTGTCAYLRQAGNGILSVVFASTGAYTINTRRFYNLIFCTGSLSGASYTIGFLGSGAGPGNSFTIQTGQGITNINSWGTVFCKGYY